MQSRDSTLLCRKRSRSGSPYRFGMNQAMDAQERLARRLERAKELTKIKKEEERKKIAENSLLGLKDDKLKGQSILYLC